MQVSQVTPLAILLFIHGTFQVRGGIVEFEKFVRPNGSWGRQPIVLQKDGGYTNVLLAIHKDVKESCSIIDGIKEIMTLTSRLLYNGTNGTLFFRSVSILIPDHWNKSSEYERPLPNETFHTARIIIRNETSEGLPPSFPFVRQLQGRGSEAEYMYLPSSVFTSKNESLERQSAETILKLWGGLLCGRTETYREGSEWPFPPITPCEQLREENTNSIHEMQDHQRDFSTTFRMLQRGDSLSVIILDDRENLKTKNKPEQMKEAFEEYVWNLLPAYSWLGVVVVNDTGQQVVDLLKLWEGPEFRLSINEMFYSSFTYGDFSLVDAFLRAYEMLSVALHNTDDVYIFLMSDETDVSPSLNDVMRNITSEGLSIASLPFSTNRTETTELENTINTDFTINDINRLHRLEDGERYVRYLLSSEHLQPFESISYNLSMENTYMDSVLVRVRVSDPSNRWFLYFRYYTEADLPNPVIDFPRTFMDVEFDLAAMDILIEENSIQRLEMMSNISQKVSLEVFSTMLSTVASVDTYFDEPIHVRTSFKSKEINFAASNGSIPLYVSILKNQRPVLNVSEVTVTIRSPDGVTSMTQLQDNGLDVDFQSQDGIYSNYFTNFTTEGQYKFEVKVHSGDKTCVWYETRSSDSNRSACHLLDPFQRVPDSTNFTVTAIPPSKVVDLKAEKGRWKRSATLSWTGVGEDLMIGRADHYEIRYSENESDITQKFDSANLFRNFSSCDHDKEQISLDLTFSGKEGTVFFLAVRAVDSRGNRGGVSNVVQLKFPDEPVLFIQKKVWIQTKTFMAATIIVLFVSALIGIALLARIKYLSNRVDPRVHCRTNQDLSISGITLVDI